MQRSILTTTAVLVALGALVLAGCGVGGGTPESKISETTDNYLRALSSGDTTKACAQLTPKARRAIGSACGSAMEKIASRVGADRLADAADEGSSISVDGSNGSATLKGLDGARLDLVSTASAWLIDSGYALDGRSLNGAGIGVDLVRLPLEPHARRALRPGSPGEEAKQTDSGGGGERRVGVEAGYLKVSPTSAGGRESLLFVRPVTKIVNKTAALQAIHRQRLGHGIGPRRAACRLNGQRKMPICRCLK